MRQAKSKIATTSDQHAAGEDQRELPFGIREGGQVPCCAGAGQLDPQHVGQ